MIVERQNDEILVRFSSKMAVAKIQSIIDYLRYEELTANSSTTGKDLEKLINDAKKGRWDRIGKELKLDE